MTSVRGWPSSSFFVEDKGSEDYYACWVKTKQEGISFRTVTLLACWAI